MRKTGIYWEFYKSTLVFSMGSALMFSVLMFPIFLKLLPVAFITVGTFTSLFYKNYSRKQEYYFYFNRSITKTELCLFTALLNAVIGVSFILFFNG